MTLYEELAAANIATANHESDLYFPRSPASIAILAKYPLKQSNATTFINQAPPHKGETWFNVPFAFDPFWANKPH
jgi:hypothetical protein